MSPTLRKALRLGYPPLSCHMLLAGLKFLFERLVRNVKVLPLREYGSLEHSCLIRPRSSRCSCFFRLLVTLLLGWIGFEARLLGALVRRAVLYQAPGTAPRLGVQLFDVVPNDLLRIPSKAGPKCMKSASIIA